MFYFSIFVYEQNIPYTKLFSYRNRKVASLYYTMLWQCLINYDIRFAFDPLSCNVLFKTLDMYAKFNGYIFGFRFDIYINGTTASITIRTRKTFLRCSSLSRGHHVLEIYQFDHCKIKTCKIDKYLIINSLYTHNDKLTLNILLFATEESQKC